jgi:hypothetical protein
MSPNTQFPEPSAPLASICGTNGGLGDGALMVRQKA